MKNLKLLILAFLSISTFTIIQAMEEQAGEYLAIEGDESLGAWDNSRMDLDTQKHSSDIVEITNKRKKSDCCEKEKEDIVEEPKSKKVKRSEINFKLEELKKNISELDLDKKKELFALLNEGINLLKFEINSEQNKESFLFILPSEVLLHIFEYCIAMPHKINKQNLYQSVKQARKAFFGIISACKILNGYCDDLNKMLKISLTHILKEIVKESVYFNKMQGYYDFDLYQDSSAEVLCLLKAGADYNAEFEIEAETNEDSDELLIDSDGFSTAKKSLKDLVFTQGLWHADIARKLMMLMSSDDLNQQDNDGTTLFMRALLGMGNQFQRLIMLEYWPFNLNLQNKLGDTALILCVKIGSLQCINGDRLSCFDLIPKIMLRNIDANIVNNKGDTALHCLIKRCRKNVDFVEGIKALLSGLESKVDPNIQDAKGNTALMLLMRQGKCPKYRIAFIFLLSKGARLDLKNKAGKDVWDISKGNRRKLVVQCMDFAARKKLIFCEISQSFFLIKLH